MRSLVLVATLGILSLAPSAASAGVLHDFFDRPDLPYCLQGRDYGTPGLCEFPSYEACEAAASGTASYCGINPRFAFAQPAPYSPSPPPPRPHHRRRHHPAH
ncbi:MAG TPA: DUF3551 domain-containing protein [Bradyrhizobium sp.]|nr:DUF3551 domain-containing protein [Bradyrhizobium sp.]